MQHVIAEVQQLGDLDPAARDELVKNLKETDPNLWPLVVDQVRANLAWQRQAEREHLAAGRPDQAPPAASLPGREASVQTADATTYGRKQTAADPGEADRGPAPPATQQERSGAAPKNQADAPSGVGIQTVPPSPTDTAAQTPAANSASSAGPEDEVVPASHEAPSAEGWQSHVSEAIRALESAAAHSPNSETDVARQARLRLLHLANGERDAALRPIPSLALGMQEFWSKQIYGLATLLEPKSIPEPSRRNAEAKEHLSSAVVRLGESCPLMVRNLAFVTEIQSFGVYKPFKQYEFDPGQQVLLYAEIENFKSEQTAEGFQTALRSSFQIFDASGRRVAEHEFSANRECCARARRDFFIGYDFRLPQQIFPGKHTLQLTVVDLKSQKVGQGVIEFVIKSGDR